MTSITIATAGNPNCGKTTLFNALTGARQRVGNWPGVTVDRKEGRFLHKGTTVNVVDLPGTYSLGDGSEAGLDETIARDYILSGEADIVLNIVDASNLERNLYLTAQLIEMQVPVIVALNMMDMAAESGLRIDCDKLASLLGCPVVPIIARRGKGIDALKDAIIVAADAAKASTARLSYQPEVEAAIAALSGPAAALARKRGVKPYWLAARLLEGDAALEALCDSALARQAEEARENVEDALDEDIDILFADIRYGFANSIARSAVKRTHRVSRTLSDRIDAIVLNRMLGIPIFLAVMYVMFLFAINFASAFIDFFDILTGTLLVDWPSAALTAISAPGWLIAILPQGVGAGIQTVSTFIPVIGFLFLFLTFLEDSGYMARAAFVMDRSMRAIGLPGKSFIPMVLGFGCSVPAVMATRTLDNRRDRIMTVMMSPFMSCGARLPVYALFAAAFFPVGGQNVVFALYLIGILAAIATGLLLKNTLLRGPVSPFIMELPPYHIPTARSLLRTTWDRLNAFMFKAGRVIIAVVVVLGFLNSLGTDGSFGNDDTEASVLSAIGRSITPVVEPMGIQEDNWPATVGLFTGIFAKEAVVGTLNALYGQIAENEAAGEEAQETFSVVAGISEAFASIPANLADAAASLADPLGLGVGDIADQAVAAEEQGVSTGIFGAMAARFNGRIGAFAYLLAILLYMPCVAATAAIWRESGTRWTLFALTWTTGLAYGSAVLVYQLGTFSDHPAASSLWAAGILGLLAVVIAAMRLLSSPKATVPDRPRGVTA
ncbi:Fe(2+) transporter permease subunit FeoB [Martelella lutilitoris]|uniref:Ferrous iron transport protein B n=1 Tax=Martelella lutilitoris TaxID=2583532 RepID=A0A7T7HKC8_9HYPH|nr:Fe(2+) transporter permease subunit FeoB [Martelella lutilitoris]QQM30774.1 Fe(2+) transporter permease subunit FeoB [Martelella lutilitoris]